MFHHKTLIGPHPGDDSDSARSWIQSLAYTMLAIQHR